MKRTTLRILMIFAVLVCGTQMATNLDAADRRRGVHPPDAVSGIIMSMTSNELRLRNADGDHRLRITSQTRIEGEVGVSAQVRARYVTSTLGEKFAVSIEAKREVIEVRGIIQQLSSDRFVLLTGRGEVTIRVDDRTIVVVGDAVSTFADLAVGDRVEVHALPGGDETLLALLVVAEMENVEIHGVITRITDSYLKIACPCRELEVELTSETVVRIFGRDATLADLRVGMHAEIEARRVADGGLVAVLITIEHGYELEEIHGIAVSASATALTVLARHGELLTFAILPDTIVLRRGEEITAADINPGDLVEVKAVEDSTLGLVAVRIKVEEMEMGFRELEGVIASVEGSILTVTLRDGSSVNVLIDSRTIIRVGRGTGSVADLVPGRRVEVHVWRNPDGSLTAVAIKVEIEGADDHDFEIRGSVTATGEGFITLRTMRGELTFVVNSRTLVIEGDVVLPLASIQVGDLVEIHAISDADGILTALSIRLESEPGEGMEIEVTGTVTAVSSSSITILTLPGPVTFAITGETEILINGTHATTADIVVGNRAEVKAKRRQGAWVATRIRIER